MYQIEQEDSFRTTYTTLGLILHLLKGKKELSVTLERYLKELEKDNQIISSKTHVTLGNYGTTGIKYYNTTFLPQEVTAIITKYEINGTIKTDSEK